MNLVGTRVVRRHLARVGQDIKEGLQELCLARGNAVEALRERDTLRTDAVARARRIGYNHKYRIAGIYQYVGRTFYPGNSGLIR